MPTPDSSEFTRRQKLIVQQALSTDIAKRNYFTNSYAYPVSSVSLSNFLSSISKFSQQEAPPTSTYSISASTSSVDEGATVTFTVTTTNVEDGTVLYWTNSGTTIAADFDDAVNNGTVTITSNSGTITRTLLLDEVGSENETIILQLRIGSVSGTIVATSGVVNIVDKTPTYSISASASSVNEGASVTFTVTTTNVADGTVLYWTNSGTTTSADFDDNTNSGSVTITSGSGTIVRPVLLDAVASESETVILQLRTVSTSGTVVATSGTVTVVDKTAIYAVSEGTNSVNEGSAVTFTITTVNVADGTTLYWTTSGTAIAADFTDNAVSGSFTINSNTGSVVRTAKLDYTTEGSETFTLNVRTGSIIGTVVATSAVITINDTPLPEQYTWTQITSSPTISYYNLDMTSDENTVITTRQLSIAGTQGPYISTDGGTTWTRKVTGITFNSGVYTSDVAVASGNGSIMYISQRAGGLAGEDACYKSTDGGDTWTALSNLVSAAWESIVCSSNGQIVLAGNRGSVGDPGFNKTVAYSTNGGEDWNVGSGVDQGFWTSVAMSSNGTRMYAGNVEGATNFFWSSNTGSTWNVVDVLATVRSVACSADGMTVLIGRGSSTPMVSTDGGVSFTAVSSLPTDNWIGSAVSADGKVMMAVRSIGNPYLSTDSGITWYAQSGATGPWVSSTINSIGTNILLGRTGGKVWRGVP